MGLEEDLRNSGAELSEQQWQKIREAEEELERLKKYTRQTLYDHISELYYNEDGTIKGDINKDREKMHTAAVVKKLGIAIKTLKYLGSVSDNPEDTRRRNRLDDNSDAYFGAARAKEAREMSQKALIEMGELKKEDL